MDFVPSSLPGLSKSRVDSFWHLTEQLFGPSSIVSEFNAQDRILNSGSFENNFTKKELRNAIFHLTQTRLRGQMPLTIIFFEHFLLEFQICYMLLNMYNSLLSLHYFSLAWKKRELVYFKKEGKPEGLASSYRPITLLPIFGKVYEKFILKGVNYYLSNNNNVLFGIQHGFRELRSTESALLKALSYVDLNK